MVMDIRAIVRHPAIRAAFRARIERAGHGRIYTFAVHVASRSHPVAPPVRRRVRRTRGHAPALDLRGGEPGRDHRPAMAPGLPGRLDLVSARAAVPAARCRPAVDRELLQALPRSGAPGSVADLRPGA